MLGVSIRGTHAGPRESGLRRFGGGPALLLAVAVVILGVLPHALFGRQLGEAAQFKSAYDEDTYALWAFTGGGPDLPSRWLSQGALAVLFFLSGRSVDLAMVLADALFPAMCAVFAWVLAGQATAAPLSRLLLVSGLLFGQEIFSLGCSAVWDPDGRWSLAFLRGLAPPWGSRLVPDYATSYLSLFRTPEPQVSQSILFGALALALRLAQPEDSPRRGLRFLAFAVNGALAVVNLFQAVAVLVFEGLLALVLLIERRSRRGLLVGALALTGLASVSLASLVHQGAAQGHDWATVVFPSRLPILTPAAVAAALGLLVLLVRARQSRERAGRAAAALGSVLFLTNQQVLSGWMISTRDWERYVDYPLLALGLAFLGFAGARGEARAAAWWAVPALAIAAFVLVRAQLRVFETHLDANLASVALERALGAVKDPPPGSVRLVLAEPGLAPLVQLRAQRRLDFVIDHTRTYVERIPPMAVAGGEWGLRSPFRDRLFEFFARTRRTPEEARRVLWTATFPSLATGESSLLLGLLFNVRDFWHPDTDARAGRQKEIRELLPDVRSAYAAYLTAGAGCCSEPALLLTTEPPTRAAAPERFQERLVAQAAAGKGSRFVTAFALLQTAHP